MRDGFQLLVQIPYAWTSPRLAVASEVATMDYLRKHGIPVPQVYGYSNVADNPAGTEYIIMELIRGKTLADFWGRMGYAEKNAVLDEIVRFESRLQDLQFPASSGLYYRKDLPNVIRRININALSGQFCIGPETTQCLWSRGRDNMTAERGPYRTSLETLIAGARKEIEHLKVFGRPLHPYEKILRQCVNYQPQSHLEYIDLLEKYIPAAPFLVPKTSSLKRPVIRHPSLHPAHIIMSNDMKIKAVINWQHTAILPSFLQCGLPEMLPTRYGDMPYLLKGDMPHDIPQVGIEKLEKTPAPVPGQTPLPEHHYLDISKVLNPEHYNVMAYDSKQLRQASYTAASNPWEGINMYLKTSLANVGKNWAELTQDFGNKDPCPIRLSNAEHEECLRFHSAERKAQRRLVIMGVDVGANSDGQVYPRNYKEAMRDKQELKAELLDEAKTEEERNQIREHFVFDDYCEDEYRW
ncbi:hypothetical protein KEM56_005152 [Ascosphaera pollenicola]|nr:hypothetical protein KEM56_005152 [Ascosphaera pollenicola]